MEERKWFAIIDGQVKGPFQQDDLLNKLTASSPNTFIWGRGQNEWLNQEKWHKLLKELSQQDAGNVVQERLWRVHMDGAELEPMGHDEMIRILKGKTDLSNIRLWTEGYSEWRDIYQIHKIMDELGVSRRTHPRVPIMGTLLCEGAGGQFNAKLLSISDGGLGATESGQLKIGERLKVVLKSPNMTAPIHATVEVVYVGADGYFGTKFIALQSESQSLVTEYIKKFLVSNPDLR
jgi:hypothetical protein